MTVSEMLARMSSRELTEWMAYFTIEPWGEERADLRAGIVASVIANVNRDPRKRPRPYRPEDFMPRFGAPRRQSWQEQLRIAEIITAAMGGEDRRRKDGHAARDHRTDQG